MKKSRDHQFQKKYTDPEGGLEKQHTLPAYVHKPYHPFDVVSTPATSSSYQIMSSAITINQDIILRVCGFCLLLYFFCMDLTLFNAFTVVDFANESKDPVKPWSPFRPLSMKLLMSDHMTQYITTPLSEGFNDFTRFSEMFFFITPNMISITHMVVGIIVCRYFIISDSLKTRRIGVLLSLFRFWLDALDGTVYRSHSSNKLFTSDHSSFGHLVDAVADTSVCTAFFFALWYHLGWKCPPVTETALPRTRQSENDDTGAGPNTGRKTHVTNTPVPYSKVYLFWRLLSVASLIAISSAIWDHLHTEYTVVFMKKLAQGDAAMQFASFHSASTWVSIWIWKVLQGQALWFMMFFAIFLDKIWEFIQFIKYLGWVLFIVSAAYSFHHLNSVRQQLHL